MKLTRTFHENMQQPRWVFLFLLTLGFICYGVVLNGPFLFDDEHFIQKNKYVQNFDLRQIFTTNVTEGANIEGNFYRPLQQTLYATLYALFGENALPFHLLQLLIHILNAFLLWWLIKQMGFPVEGALAGAVIFLCHPVQTESVSYISGLAGPLGFLFVLLGLHTTFQTFRQQVDGKKGAGLLCLSGLFYLFALFSKENMVVLMPILILLIGYMHASGKQFNISMAGSAVLLIAVITAIYLYFRLTTFNFTPGATGLTDQKSIYTNSIWVRLSTFLTVLSNYFELIFFPKDLHYEKDYTAYVSLLTRKALPGILFTMITAAAVIAMLFLKRWKTIGLGLGWFMAALGPYSGIVPLNAMYLEHWLYIPLAGIAIVIASLFALPLQKHAKMLLTGFLVIASLASIARTIERNTEWADYEAFYLNELKYTDESARIYNNLGMYYADQGNYSKAIRFYKKAIQKFNRYPQTHHNLARIYTKQGKVQQAFRAYLKALRIKPTFLYSLYDLYQLLQDTGQPKQAERLKQLIMQVRDGKTIQYSDIERVLKASQ